MRTAQSLTLVLTFLALPAFAQSPSADMPPTVAQAATPGAPGAPAVTPAPIVPSKPSIVGVDLELAFPFSNFGDVAGVGFGILGRYELNLMQYLDVTGRIGYVYHLSNTINAAAISITSHVSTVPFLFGGRYFFHSPLWLHIEGGPVIVHTSVDTKGIPGTTGTQSASDTSTKFMLSGGVGYRWEGAGPGSLLIGGYFQIVSLGSPGDTLQLVGMLGYDAISF